MTPETKPVVPDTRAAEKFLAERGISFEKQQDGTIRSEGTLNVCNMRMTALPDLSMVHHTGTFSCSDNPLTSLKGAPASAAILRWPPRPATTF